VAVASSNKPAGRWSGPAVWSEIATHPVQCIKRRRVSGAQEQRRATELLLLGGGGITGGRTRLDCPARVEKWYPANGPSDRNAWSGA
jgi:hypothetical protein